MGGTVCFSQVSWLFYFFIQTCGQCSPGFQHSQKQVGRYIFIYLFDVDHLKKKLYLIYYNIASVLDFGFFDRKHMGF